MSTWSDLKNNPRLNNIFQTRVKILKLIREFFWSKDFVETDTPIAVRYASQEPYLNPLPIAIHDPLGKSERFYLHTSPEYSLKKILAAGFGKIFEITRCFRDFENFGGDHNTEFTMIEWYRAPGTYQQIMKDTEDLFKYVGKNLEIKKLTPPPYGGGARGGVEINCEWDRKSMKEIWKEYIYVDLDNYLEIKKLRKLAESKRYKIDDSDRYEDIFYKIFLNEVEPKLGAEKPIFIYDYPACMCSLSRLCESDKRYAERFELYIGGLELANAFGELTDAEEQRLRLEGDKKLREELGKETWPVDPDFISALAGLPAEALAQAGIALGVDRMILLFTAAKDLNEVIFGAISDQLSL